MSNTMEGRLALVTGASRGIGRAVALDLARAGAHVVALARTQGALEELDDDVRRVGGDATLVPCDLKDSEALDRLGAALHERWGHLDVLVANAGVLGPITPIGHVDPKQWDNVVAVNLTANYRLIRSLDPLLRASDAGRAVFVSSAAGHRAEMKPYWGPYAITKAALDAMARTYAAETATTSNVVVTVVNPGPLRTRMRAAAMPGEDPETLKTPEELSPSIVALCSPEFRDTGKLYDFPTDRLLSFQGPA
ncbi:SDR family NAD(P)-dependent oxidoreductase [Lichenibacterium dinghuense]|uniref:SDR family NAD(P)-dependent oxidoreductase n=1 Tax=Lichenibacterium dinghuense TaxID=2895977 RepID=UPI001F1F2493|nr:SDR family NAD(P)-dependent oxidoreductase [Lichenibacterium sp. 6Y81]